MAPATLPAPFLFEAIGIELRSTDRRALPSAWGVAGPRA